MSTNSERILGEQCAPLRPLPLFDTPATRRIESTHGEHPAAESLMQRAGFVAAKLVLALAPHAQLIWIACGPGNNGGDGLEVAIHLHRMGRNVVVSELQGGWVREGGSAAAYQRAIDAGVTFQAQAPDDFDFCIDALFGIGRSEGFSTGCQAWIKQINSSVSQVLSIDIPTGLHADNGVASDYTVRADFTLSLLTLKPGLFTADGRAFSGDIWFHSLDTAHNLAPIAYLSAPPYPVSVRAHNTHKGTFGDVAVIGGDTGMVGAAVLAARAALHGSAGRVFLGLLSTACPTMDDNFPELMVRDARSLPIATMSVVAGCGAGAAMAGCLLDVLRRSRTLVLDADGLNHLALSKEAQRELANRAARTTVLTPHPLEAARLLTTSVAHIQANRLAAAQSLADRWQCVVVLKGSGSIIAGPGHVPCINPTGNSNLATAGTGDVLAGLIGSYVAQHHDVFAASCAAVYRHGQVADRWPASAGALTAQRLARAV